MTTKTVRCKNCQHFLCYVDVLVDDPPIGTIIKVREMKCRGCKCFNEFPVEVKAATQEEPK